MKNFDENFSDNLEHLDKILKEAFLQNEKAKEFLCNDLPVLYLNFEYPNLSFEEFQAEKKRLTLFVCHLLEHEKYHPNMLSYLVRIFKRQTIRIRVRNMFHMEDRN